MDSVTIGPVEIHYSARGDLTVEAFGEKAYTSLRIGSDQWREITEAVSEITNLVPVTLLLTTLIDESKIDPVEVKEFARLCAGTVHFRPNNRSTHAQARKIVGTLVGWED